MISKRLLLPTTFVMCALACSRPSSEPAAATPTPPPSPRPSPASAEVPWLDDQVPEINIAVRRSGIHGCDSFRYRPLANDPAQYEIKCDRDDRIYQVNPATGEVELVDSGSWLSQMGAAANPSDLRQAREFLASLPPACARSSIETRSEGTVVISLACAGTDQSLKGSIHIKDGVVTRIQ